MGRYTRDARSATGGEAALLQGGSWGAKGEWPVAKGECTVGANCPSALIGEPGGDQTAPFCGPMLQRIGGGADQMPDA
jgi:hypothetical protein